MIKITKLEKLKKKIKIQNIKNILFEKYISLITPSKTELSPMRNQYAKNWSVFSIMNWYANQKDIVENVYQEFTENKPTQIQKQILTENYYFTIFDLLIIFKQYKIPVILKMTSSQAFQTNANVNYFSTVTNKDKYTYVILVGKIKKRKENKYGLLKLNDSYKIPTMLLMKNSKINYIDNNTSLEEFVSKSILYLEKRQRIGRKNDLKYKNKKRGKIIKLKTKTKLQTKKSKTPTATKKSKTNLKSKLKKLLKTKKTKKNQKSKKNTTRKLTE